MIKQPTPMSIVHYANYWAKAFDFKSRATRAEFWTCMFYGALFGIVAIVIDGKSNGPIYGFFELICLLPGLAVSVRRMHDIDRTGWWIVVPIVSFVFLLFGGTQGPNRFGSDPYATMGSSGSTFPIPAGDRLA